MMAVEKGEEVTGSGYISKVELTGIANGFKVERKERRAKTATVWGYLPSIKEPIPLALAGEVLTREPPRKSLKLFILCWSIVD